MKRKLYALINSDPISLLINIAWVYITYFICRIAFLGENFSSYSSLDFSRALTLFRGGVLFDTSAICYTNSLFILLFLAAMFMRRVPLWYNILLKWIFVVVNSLAVLINLADAVFFVTRLQRSTAATLTEFRGEGNLLKIAGAEIIGHWYFILLALLMIWCLAAIFRRAHGSGKFSWKVFPFCCVFTLGCAYFTVSGMRGALLFTKATRPISVNFAFKYTTEPIETGLVLNTTFSLLRTIGETTMPTPQFFATTEALEAIYSPVHNPNPGKEPLKKNIVILIIESFSKEFIGAFNHELDNNTYKGYTPYFDAMLDSCMYFDETLANAFFSIDAPPAVLASIPRAERPFMVSPHSLNHINSIASELKNWGYETAFFHGADNESLGINAFVKQAGFERYYGQNEFYADPRFGGRKEFDGTWGVWDEPFLQFFCATLDEIPQPFVASVFTLSSHHPFRIPEKYKDVFKDEGEFELHKCIRYADYALHQFFETARTQPWFYNTIFVITADHTSARITHDQYKTDMGTMRIPIAFYDPSGLLPRGRQPGIFQQIDIMPTLLSYVGYDRSYIAFGQDRLTTPAEDSWAFGWDSLPMLVMGDYMMVFEGDSPIRFYNYKTDLFHEENLLGKGLPEEEIMETKMKAIMQSYLERMNTDDVTVR